MIEVEKMAIEMIKADCIRDMYNEFNKKSQTGVVAVNNGFMAFAEEIIFNDLIPDHLCDYLQDAINEIHNIALSLLKSL